MTFSSLLSDRLIDYIQSYLNASTFDRIILSVCSGRSEIEMQSNDLCVCFDINKRSLYASKFAEQYMSSRKGNVLYHYHNMQHGLFALLRDIRHRVNMPVDVLFQHPCPTGDNNSIAFASKDCIQALLQDAVNSIHFVYDTHLSNRKTFWKGNQLQHLSLAKCADLSDLLTVTEPVIISEANECTVKHPVFGSVQRSGWALMKKGSEMAFSITKSKA